MQYILSSRWLNTRRGTIALGASAALLAAILLLVYLNRYRESLSASAQPNPVLVANRLIPKGSSTAVIAGKGHFETVMVAKDQLKEGAVSDPAALKDRVAVADIYPGQQITAADFSATTSDRIPTRIVGDQRAISVPLDSAHGMIGQVSAGDYVDVYAGLNLQTATGGTPSIKLLLSNVLVLSAPAPVDRGPGATGTPNLIFQVKTEDAPKLAYVADNGTLWVVLRPTNGAKPSAPSLVTAQSILLGKPAVPASGG